MLAAVFAKESSSQDEKSVKKQKFVLVDEPDSPVVPETKTAVPQKSVLSGVSVSEMASLHRAFQRANRSTHLKKGGKGKWNYRPFCTDVVERTQQTGSSGTAFFPVKTLEPNSSGVTEASLMGSIFDEQRCVGITINVRVTASASGVVEGAWAVVFDCANSGAYTSVVGTTLSGQRMGPIAMNFASGTSSFTKTGFITHRFKTLNTLPPTGSNSELVGGGWFASIDTTAQVGFLKYAVDALSGGTATIDTFIQYHMEYRERT